MYTLHESIYDREFLLYNVRREDLPLFRCQCSSEAGGVRCYNGWCDVQDLGGKVGACALVRVGTRQHFACVRVKPTSDDSCKVEQKNGETLVS
ncbi:hypothetical protein GCK32_019604 [Trichostrongylus colubriformis]|uniref:Uncharacterized protein n=1 Tax=Trichostrongylus colubriformis TaxID=6319 RepID=A0AAN8FNP4_TRICO